MLNLSVVSKYTNRRPAFKQQFLQGIMNNYTKIIKNQKGSTIIMITLLVMASILTVSLSLSNVVINGLKSSLNQANATKAYFAAETGAERVLWEIRKKEPTSFDPWDDGCTNLNNYILNTFDGCEGASGLNHKNNYGDALFYINYATSTPTTTLTIFGEYKGTRRALKLKY